MQSKLSDPTPLGLAAFGITTGLLACVNAGFFPIGSPILAQAIFVGGLVQLIVGIMEFVKGSTFDSVSFCCFGGFWLSYAAFDILPALGFAAAPSAALLGTFMLIWAIFVFLLLVGVFKGGRLLTVVDTTLFIVLILLAFSYYLDSIVLVRIAGWVGIVCGASALYFGCAITLFETKGRQVLPY
ncbi:MAG: acetate uptake transporter [Deltaproteobacteria bacterium]|nr:acetate uptake transporter [Deltaproteobacteria bacterium]